MMGLLGYPCFTLHVAQKQMRSNIMHLVDTVCGMCIGLGSPSKNRAQCNHQAKHMGAMAMGAENKMQHKATPLIHGVWTGLMWMPCVCY